MEEDLLNAKYYYLVVFGGQKFLSFVSDQSFKMHTPHAKNKSVPMNDKTDRVLHGHLQIGCTN